MMKTLFENPYVLNVLWDDHPGIAAVMAAISGRYSSTFFGRDRVESEVLAKSFFRKGFA